MGIGIFFFFKMSEILKARILFLFHLFVPKLHTWNLRLMGTKQNKARGPSSSKERGWWKSQGEEAAENGTGMGREWV